MSTTDTTITITPVTGTADLLHIYPNQQQPQDCYLELDLRNGSLSADWNGEIGNAVPSDVWHNIVRRYSIPPLSTATVNALMEEIAPLAATVVAHAAIEWDGSNHVGTLDTLGETAEDRMAARLESVDSDLYWVDANDWMHSVEREIGTAIAAGTDLDTIHDEYQGDGLSEDYPIILGLMNYLESLADDVRAEQREAEAAE